jgi:hypothetical protein
MGLKDGLDNVVGAVKDAAANVKDAASEATHKSVAEGEQAKRDVAGDQMTAGEKASSMVNQAKNSVQADVDSSKQTIRNNT